MKVLVIEDEPKVASFIKRAVEELSFAVDVAYDGGTLSAGFSLFLPLVSRVVLN